MQITDPIADMLTRIRNANSAKHETVDVPVSNMKKAIAEILLEGNVNHALLSVIYDLIAFDITFLKKNVCNSLLHIGNGNINCFMLC